MNDTWIKLLSNVAPAIGTALGGPGGGIATKFLLNHFLGKDKADTQDELSNAVLNATPGDLVKLKELDNKFSTDMRSLGISEFMAGVEDRKSARELFKTNIWPQITLSWLFLLCYFMVLYGLFTGRVVLQESVKDMTLLLVGLLTREIPTIMAFWFGNSFSGQKKATDRANGN